MCRRIITHYMHHDVAAPMILDPTAPSPIIYANPLRTNFHRCELALPPPCWLLNTPEKCHYHTCCFPREQIEHCDELFVCLNEEEQERDIEPEECPGFILEHHHERLPYFGDEGAYNECLPYFADEGIFREAIPATWRNLELIRKKNPNWFPNFTHNLQYRANWEESLFAECERLYTLEYDASILYAVLHDLITNNSNPWRMVQAARADFLNAEGELHRQRKLVFDCLEWATQPCGMCGGSDC